MQKENGTSNRPGKVHRIIGEAIEASLKAAPENQLWFHNLRLNANKFTATSKHAIRPS
jgi:hypothetical protein